LRGSRLASRPSNDWMSARRAFRHQTTGSLCRTPRSSSWCNRRDLNARRSYRGHAQLRLGLEVNAHQLKYFASGIGNILPDWSGDDETVADARTAVFDLDKHAHRISPDVYGSATTGRIRASQQNTCGSPRTRVGNYSAMAAAWMRKHLVWFTRYVLFRARDAFTWKRGNSWPGSGPRQLVYYSSH
jgi:hypothetical protein